MVPQHAETHASGVTMPATAGVIPANQLALDLMPGPLVQTGAKYDIALDGPGFIELDGPDGSIFTRDGRLHVNLDNTCIGQLMCGRSYSAAWSPRGVSR
jgi:flagellar basal body rod protein FlgG